MRCQCLAYIKQILCAYYRGGRTACSRAVQFAECLVGGQEGAGAIRRGMPAALHTISDVPTKWTTRHTADPGADFIDHPGWASAREGRGVATEPSVRAAMTGTWSESRLTISSTVGVCIFSIPFVSTNM